MRSLVRLVDLSFSLIIFAFIALFSTLLLYALSIQANDAAVVSTIAPILDHSLATSITSARNPCVTATSLARRLLHETILAVEGDVVYTPYNYTPSFTLRCYAGVARRPGAYTVYQASTIAVRIDPENHTLVESVLPVTATMEVRRR